MNLNFEKHNSFDKIPKELKELDRWVCWRLEERKGKPTKVPVNPKPKRDGSYGMAMSNNTDTWGSFNAALECLKHDNALAGIGFMLGDGFVGVDIDECKEDGIVAEHARDIVSTLDSFTEYSPSGQGLHVICKGKLPEGRRQVFIERDGKPNAHLGIYDERRFFCMTGQVLDDAHVVVEERNNELAIIHEKYINVQKTDKNVSKKPVFVTESTSFVTESEVYERIDKSKNRDAVYGLLNGNWKGKYSSCSEADMALMNHIVYYADRNQHVAWNVFSNSGLFRQEEYQRNPKKFQATLSKAVSDCRECHSERRARLQQEWESRKNRKQKSQEVNFQNNVNFQNAPEIDSGLDQLAQNAPPEQLPDWITGPYNDTWNTERLIEAYGENIRYNPSRGWFVWNEKYWEYDELNRIRTMANESIERLYRYKSMMYQKYKGEDGKAGKMYSGYMDWLAKSRNTSRKDNMIKEAESWEGVRTLPKRFDADKCMANTQNGTMDMEHMTFLPHNKDDLITKIMPVDYDPYATAPIWDSFLNRIFEGNQNTIKFLQRATGYSFTALTNEQCIFILYGTGKNGKSTFLDAIKVLMADYAKNAPVSTFMRKDWSNTNSYELARLYGARIVTTGEPDKGDRFAESLIKQVTGGESINAEHKYKDPFEFYPDFKLWIGTNYKPEIVGTDLGIWRRIMLVPFEVTIPPEERDINFGKKLLAELPGIFNWVMEGYKSWQKQGLNPPQEVLAATEDYREEMDVFQNFLNDCMIQRKDAVIKFKDLYTVYKEWARENGIKNPMNTNTIGRRLKEKGIKEHNNKTSKGREGIELSEEGKRLWRKGTEYGDGNGGSSGKSYQSHLEDAYYGDDATDLP